VHGDRDREECTESGEDVRVLAAAGDGDEHAERVHDADERELVRAGHPDERDGVATAATSALCHGRQLERDDRMRVGELQADAPGVAAAVTR
jgi:hypothetical protein